MPILVETERKMSKRRIYAPGSTLASHTDYVEYMTIDEITFQVEQEQNQFYTFKYENNKENETRIVVTKDLDGIKVERIKYFKIADAQQYNQWFKWAIAGWEDDTETPEHLETHEFTAKNKDTGSSVTFQRIDSMYIIDPNDYNQEWTYKLKWPDDDNEDTTRADTKDDFTEINPPYRYDPWQAVIKSDWLCMLVLYDANKLLTITMGNVYNGKFSPREVAYKTTLPTSNWGAGSVAMVNQEQASEQISIILSQVSFGTSISFAPSFGVGYITDAVLKKQSAAADLEFADTISYPSMNIASGATKKDATIYTLRHTFKYNVDTGFTVTETIDLDTTPDLRGNVSKTGVRKWNEIAPPLPSLDIFDFPGAHSATGHYYYMETSKGNKKKRYDPPIPKDSTYNILQDIWWHEAEQDIDCGDAVVGHGRYPLYSITTTFEHGTHEQWSAFTWDAIYACGGGTGGGYIRDSGDIEEVHCWPYAVDGKAYRTMNKVNVSTSNRNPYDIEIGTIVTPYATHEGSYFQPLWNLHDGGTLIQGYKTADRTHIWINGVDAKTIGGIAANNISAIFINIPLSRIKKLK